jgi:hypothetical protein
MEIFKRVRRRWRIWKIRAEIRKACREADEIALKLKQARVRKKGEVKRLLRVQMDINVRRLKMERRARIF